MDYLLSEQEKHRFNDIFLLPDGNKQKQQINIIYRNSNNNYKFIVVLAFQLIIIITPK